MRRFLPLLRARLGAPSIGTAPLSLWHLSIVATIVSIAPLVALGRPLRGQSPDDQVQYWIWGASYLLLAILIAAFRERDDGPALGIVPVLAGATFGLGYLALRYVAESTFSRKVAAASLVIGLAGVLLPVVARRVFPFVLACVTGVAAFGFWRSPSPTPGDVSERVIVTGLQPVTLVEHHGVLNTHDSPGGAIAALDSGVIAVTALGEFHRVDFPPGSARPVTRALPLTIDFNREAFVADSSAVFREAGVIFDVRTNDILLDTTVSPARVYVSVKHWNPAGRCLTNRVSSAELPALGAPAKPGAWKTVFETSPCVRMSYDRGHGGFSSRLAWERPGHLLVTLGDFGYQGEDGAEGPQDPANPYGKVLRIDVSTGRSSVFTIGHRNPQGLSVGDDGSVWSSEHGPQGGDEVNVLESGANYGWPLATYGVQYGLEVWPLARNRHDHGEFHEPALAFTPSIGISNLIHLRGAAMPAWADDILVASLKDRALYRLRRRNDRVISQERLQIGYRIRDLEEIRDGRVVLWTDAGAFVVLARASGRFGGAMRYAACVGCHGEQLEGTAAGPSLQGIVGRPIASDPNFDYSPALRSLGGAWTLERLHSYLKSPSSFAPGTTMSFEGMESEAIYSLLEYMRNHFK